MKNNDISPIEPIEPTNITRRQAILRAAGVGALVSLAGLGVENVSAATTPLTPPPLATAAGYNTLVFDEEFDVMPDIGYGTEGHKWNAGLWWESVPDPSAFSVSNSALTINAGANADINLCTQWHDHQGGEQFLGGYFEARMNCFDWSAFWLFCWDRPTVYGNLVLPGNPMTWTNEIDIIETDPAYPNSFWQTLHKNSSGDGGVPDAQNYPARFNTNVSPIGAWHSYGLLWTQSAITWCIDGIPTQTIAPYASTWQPVQLILTASPGGVNGSHAGSPGQTNPPETKIDYVRVWH